MQMATFKTIIRKVVAECPVNLGGIIFVHFIASFEATLSGSVAKEFRFGLIRARTILKLIILFFVLFFVLMSLVIEVIVPLYSLI